MKDPMIYIERFCRNHPNFGVRNLMKYVCIANVVFWLLGAVNPVLLSYLRFDPYLVLHGQIWRLVTFALYPPSTGMLAFIAFYFYYWIGSTLEQYWGTAKFNVYFFSGILLTLLYGFLIYFITGLRIQLNAEYVYLSMFFSFAAMFPDMQVLLFFIIPIKMKWLALVDAAFFILGVVTTRFPVNLLPVVAVLNFFVFCGGTLLRGLRPDRRGLSRSGIPLLFPLRGLPLLLPGPHQQPHPFYRIREFGKRKKKVKFPLDLACCLC